jgi:hypothetical protein
MVKTLIPRSIRPADSVKLYGVGNSSDPFNVGEENVSGVGLWLKSSGTGDNRTVYARLYMAGTGAGEAVRAYATAQNAAAATGGTLNGLHASLSVDASSAISGQGNAARFTLDLAADTRTAGANLAGITIDSNFGTGNTIGAGCAFIRVTDLTAVKMPALFNVPVAANGTIFAAHITQAMTHSIKIVDAAGTAFYIMCTNAATNRS